MSKGASFELRLIDRVSKTSRSVARSLAGITKGLRRTGGIAGDTDRAVKRSMAGITRSSRRADRAMDRRGRFRDRSGRLREGNGRFVGGGGGGGGRRGAFGIGGGALDVLKGNLLTAATTQLLQTGAAAVRAAGGFVLFKQNSELAFEQLTRNEVPGGKLFEHASALAKRYGLDLLDTTKQYQKFLALQFNPREIDKLTKMGADLRVLGNDAEAVQGIFTALGQIKSKGKMQAEEMMQLAERGISGQLIWEEVGKLLGGKSVDEVRKLQEQGKVDAGVGLLAIENAVNRKLHQNKLGEAGAKFADSTIAGFIGRAKAFGQDAGLKLVDRLVAPLTRGAGGGLDRMMTFLGSPEGVALVDRMAAGLERAVGFVADFGSAFGQGFGRAWSTLSESASMFMGAFAGGDGATTAHIVQQLAVNLGEAAALAAGFGIAFVGAGIAIAGFAGMAWEVGKSVAMGIVEPMFARLAGIAMWWDELTGIWNDGSRGLIGKAWGIGKEIVSGLVKGMWSLATYPVDQLVSIVGAAYDGTKQALGIHSPSRRFAELGRYSAEGFGVGLREGTTRAARASERFGEDMLVSSASSAATLQGMQPAGGGGVMRPIFRPVINISGAGGDAQATADVVARTLRREIDAYFRELSLETA